MAKTLQATNGGRFAKIGYDTGNNAQNPNDDKPEWICRQIDAGGYENLVLSYYWNGDNDTEVNSDFGVVEYRATSNGSTDNTCNSNENSWDVLATHDLNTESNWSDLYSINLPDELDNDDSFFIRFRNDASSNQEFFRVDGIEITGDEIKTTIQIKKLIDADGDLQTTDDQTPASGWNFSINETFSSLITGNDGLTAPVDVSVDGENNEFDITEVLDEEYNLLSASCVGAEDTGEFNTQSATVEEVELEEGDEVLCTFINAPKLATLNVCKIIVDEEGGIVTGVDAGATFSINLSGPSEFEQESVFTTPLTLTDDLLDDNGDLDDAQCYTYQVAPGQYLYDEEEIDGGEGSWGPTYHDFFSEVPQSIDDFSVLTEDGSEGDNDDADGVINIAAGQERTLAIINTFLGGQGGDPDQCEVTEMIVSDTLTLNADESPAVILSLPLHLAWTALINGASWIWSAEPMPEGYVADVTKKFSRSFTIDGAPLSGTLKIAADNGYAVTLNGDPLCADPGEFNYSSVDTCVIDASDLVQGVNVIEFTVTNKAQSGGTLQSNPAGLIYELSITEDSCVEPPAQCVPGVPGQELLTNGSFETPEVSNSQNWNIFPSNTPGLGWVVEWLNPSGAPAIANLEIQKSGLFPGGASDGVQWVELDSDWDGPSGSINGETGAVAISQTILTEVGETYTFSFDFSARPNTAVAQNAVRVLVDGDSTLVDQTVSAVNAVTQNTWLPQSFTFVADSILTTVSLSDAGASNNSIGTLIDNASLMCTPPEVPKFASVTLCKVDTQAQGLPGWTLLLEKGDAVDSFSVPSTSSAGTNSTPLTAGTSYVAVATGVWLNDREPDNHVDAEYSTEDGWTTHVDGFTGYQDDILELQIAQTSGAWGAYNSLHSYAQAFTPGANGPVNFRIFDGTGSTPNESWYGDNSGSLNVVITEGYAGITGENGCVTFTGVPYGTYDISEMLQDGWVADSENPSTAVVDSPEETFTFVNAPVQPDPETATLHATKIVCEAEEYLPNWGDGQTVSEITATTAAEFLAEVNEGPGPDHCWLEDGWEFQWVSNSGSSSNPGDNILTPAPSPWASTGLTALDGTVSATVPAGERIWVREVLKENYVQFGGQNTHAHVSAELYCSTDVLNYDNWDYIDPVNEDASYYCVAFNAPVAPQCGPDQHVNSENQCEDNNNESHADVWVEKEVSGGPYEVGSSVTYTITVGNEGPFVANTIVVTDLLPAGLVYSGHDASNEGPSDDFYNEVTGVWTIASLGVDGVAVLEIYAEIAEGFEDETITNIVTVETASEDDTSENDEDSVAIFVDDEDEGGGGGSGPEIQSFFGANGPISGLGGGPLGQVLGASTEGQVLGESCGLYLDKFIRFNRNNDADQVRKLQQFLNKWLGLSLPLTGFYGPLTYEAVLQFQTQYAETILTPWGLTSPTGIVYLTTLRQINMLECPVLSLELPPLTPWTN